ncbi:uncharacterized protein LOC119092903 isoform X1 [Pollicipes pollicipes]|uniref:uncharacterized protein LOC119092903 isoform X1 n=1 Tax=Pollicipes pollicipes TaxID=41117 RepID=UPI0018854213|nr:uncharacterized protein LOC119092903 isoform X1 [Pollicipes pollicipes]
MLGPTMNKQDVQLVNEGDIDHLVARLEAHGPITAKSRCLLLLIQRGVNTCKHWIYASPDTSKPLVSIVITLAAPDLHVVDAFAPEDAASMRRLAAAMLAPELHEHLWRVPFRADCWPCYLEPVLDYVRHQREFSSRLIEANTLFVKEASSPAEDVLTRCPPGVSVRPLDGIHLDTVKRFWPYTAVTPDADGVMRDGMTVGLSVGVFVAVDNDVASSPDGELVCWVLLNRNAFLGFLHTLESHRRRGLARLAMAELTRLFLQRRLPCLVATAVPSVMNMMKPLGYSSVCNVFWAQVYPAEVGATQETV